MNVFGIVFLWSAVVLSALGVVWSAHRTRLATSELEALRHEAADLHVQSGQFLLERASLAAYARIERMAANELDMTVPDVEEIVVVKP